MTNPNQWEELKENIIRSIEEDYFEMVFGIPLNTKPISGRIIVHEKGGEAADILIEFDERMSLMKKLIARNLDRHIGAPFQSRTHQEVMGEVERLIAEEMIVDQKEGQPTSRLTSLATRLNEQETK